MSFNRDMIHDRARTLDVLNGQPMSADGRANWLGHRLDAATATLDEMLLTGATRAQLEAVRGAIDEHLYHLRVEHGLPLVEANGSWSFDRAALGGMGSAGEEKGVGSRSDSPSG